MTGHTSSVIEYRKAGNKEVLGMRLWKKKTCMKWCARRQWLAKPYYSSFLPYLKLTFRAHDFTKPTSCM